MSPWAGTTVVITGASGGIGTACTAALQTLGATVIGVDQAGSSTADEHVVADLADPEAADLVAEAVGDRALVGLVNNAAASTSTPTDAIDAGQWDRIQAVNVRAPFLLSERLLPRLVAAGGSVVHVASVHAFATSVGAVPYAASKGALAALTRAQAVDWAARGIRVRVNAVAPGAIDTPMLRDGLARTGTTVEELAARHPVGRVGRAQDVAAAIVHLLDPDTGFVHGAVLPVDGGVLAQLSSEVAPESEGR